jgi:hypothetical protein
MNQRGESPAEINSEGSYTPRIFLRSLMNKIILGKIRQGIGQRGNFSLPEAENLTPTSL